MKLAVVLTCSLVSSALLIPEIAKKQLENSTSSLAEREPCDKSQNILHELENNTEVDAKSSYIVTLKDGHDNADYAAHQEWVNRGCSSLVKKRGIYDAIKEKFGLFGKHHVKFFNFDSFRGYVGTLSPEVVKAISEDPLVEFIEKDEEVHISKRIKQEHATWGLERVSQRKLRRGLYFGRYLYDKNAGDGVVVFVIDTGIDAKNPEFEGRATASKSFRKLGALTDRNGHGTHVAGIIAGKTFGVAKKAKIESLKAFGTDGIGYKSSIILAIQYAIRSHKKRVRSGDPMYKGAVINMLLGCLPSIALDRAVRAADNAGIVVVLSAGNDGDDACRYSPARSIYTITVGATDYDDSFALFSNEGACIDILAPGVLIHSASFGNKPSVLTGTSMAAPHVSGVAALLMSLQPSTDSEYFTDELISAKQVRKKLMALATANTIMGVPENTPNRFLYNGGEDDLSEIWD